MIYIHNCITCHVDVTKRVKSFLSRSVFVMLIFLRKMRKRYILMVLLQIFIQAFTSLLNSSKQFLLAYSAFALFYPCIMFLKNILVQFLWLNLLNLSVIFFMKFSYLSFS